MNAFGSFLKLIERRRQPRLCSISGLQREEIRCSFAEFLRRVRQNPAIAESTPRQLARVIKGKGIDWKRTVEMCSRFQSDSLLCYNAFAGLEFIDPRSLHALVDFLEHRRPGSPILFLIGAPRSGKTVLVHRLGQLLLEANAVPAVNDVPLSCHPLRLLYMIPQVVATHRHPQIAARDMLEAFALDRLLDQSQRDFIRLCHQAGVAAKLSSLIVLCINQPEAFVKAVLAGLGVDEDSRWSIRPLHDTEVRWLYPTAGKALEREIAAQTLARRNVTGFQLDERLRQRASRALVRPIVNYSMRSRRPGLCRLDATYPLNFDPSSLIGSFNLATLGRYSGDDFRAWTLTGVLHRSQGSILEADEALRNSEQSMRLLVEAGSCGCMPTPDGEGLIDWEGLMIFVCTREEYQAFAWLPENAASIERCYRLYVERYVDAQHEQQSIA